jgi:hypothetical protein
MTGDVACTGLARERRAQPCDRTSPEEVRDAPQSALKKLSSRSTAVRRRANT